jgi:guanylate kinase
VRKKLGKLIVISGPSGSGKTTLLSALIKSDDLRARLVKSVSLTTRPKRSGERQGKDYFFISRRQFISRLRSQKILEWTRYLGYYYGTPKGLVDKALSRGKNIGLCLDLKGALKIKKLYPQSVAIFIAPPALAELKSRIKKRCQKISAKELMLRLARAKTELRQGNKYDYRLVNKKFDQTLKRLKSIVLKEIC